MRGRKQKQKAPVVVQGTQELECGCQVLRSALFGDVLMRICGMHSDERRGVREPVTDG